jgi:hypothetical protein
VIDIDDDDDSDLEIIGEKVGRSNKGKKTIDATNQVLICIRLKIRSYPSFFVIDLSYHQIDHILILLL